MKPFAAMLVALAISASPLTAARPDEPADKPDAAEKGGSDTADKKDEVPEPKVWVTRHQARIGDAKVAYTATAGTMLMKNDKDEPVALFGFTAYVKDGADPRTRPIMFAYNGGPGSASAWLHMGILGPKRTVLKDLDANTRGPFQTVENEFTHPRPGRPGDDRSRRHRLFARRRQGAGQGLLGRRPGHQVGVDFIVRYLNDNGRWAAPKFILGESYGGMRTAGVAYVLLTKRDVALNGVVLVSPYLDFAGGNAGLRLDEPYVNFLPTYAATAWYHGVLSSRPADLQPFLREVEAFAEDVYAPVLFKGARATPEERQTVLAGLARYTGLSEDYWNRANLRIDEGRFLQELMRSKGVVAGRVDTRYTGGSLNGLAESMSYDPYGADVAPAIVATFNDYYHGELKVESDRPYVLSGDLWKDWDNRHEQPDYNGGGKVPWANTGVDLAHAMTMNPRMKVLVLQGYFDLACPYRTVESAIEHLDIAPALRGNVAIEYFDAGHMMYVEPASMQKFKRDLAAFVDSNSR